MEWIRVDVDLPGLNVAVLCYSPVEQEKIFIDHRFVGADKKWYWDWGNNPETGAHTITHWMPLPEKPIA